MRVYIDTSVFGGAFDDEFQRATNLFFQQIDKKWFKPVISFVVEQELELAPLPVKELFNRIKMIAEKVELSPEVADLQSEYLDSGIVSVKSEADALHVALASVSQCSMIVSWNFKHIVNYKKIPLYNGINQANGYGSIGIYSPLEVVNNDV